VLFGIVEVTPTQKNVIPVGITLKSEYVPVVSVFNNIVDLQVSAESLLNLKQLRDYVTQIQKKSPNP
jgi:hypothetical protein